MRTILTLLCLLYSLLGTAQVTKTDYVKKYAGEYLIKIEGIRTTDIEKYTLRPDGTCVWEWKSGNFPSKKNGRWSASQGKIRTVCEGRSGDIPEDFNWKEGKFRSEDGYERHLVKIKSL